MLDAPSNEKVTGNTGSKLWPAVAGEFFRYAKSGE